MQPQPSQFLRHPSTPSTRPREVLHGRGGGSAAALAAPASIDALGSRPANRRTRWRHRQQRHRSTSEANSSRTAEGARAAQPEHGPNYQAQKLALLQARARGKSGANPEDALNRLGTISEDRGELTRAVDYYRRAADRGPRHSAAAEWSLGLAFTSGEKGLPQDPAKAHDYVQRAANRGHAGALYDLGVDMHLGTDAVPMNIEEAERLYRLAAAAGWPQARMSLGVLLATPGRTVTEYREACELFLLNATEANECGQESAYNLGVTLCDDDSPAAIRDTTEAAKMFELAASLATADEGEDLDFGAKAKFWHARLLFTGQMGHAPAGSDEQRRQMHMGARLLREAVDRGHAEAEQMLDALSEMGMIEPEPQT